MNKCFLQDIKYVVDNSKYVRIDKTKIDNLIDEIDNFNYKHWSTDTKLNLSDQDWIILVFVVESMNFCFWQKPKWKIKYKNNVYSGSNALFYTIVKTVKNNPEFLNIDYLYNMSREEFGSIFNSIEGEISLIEKRYANFKEVINNIYNNQDFYNQLFNIKTDIELLNYIVKKIKCFDDKSFYKGRTIHFNKRATLLVNDLFYVSKKIRDNLHNVNHLSGCADYGIPRTLRDYEILNYSPELSTLIDNEIEIMHDSEMEIEIRANMLYVIELIRKKLEDKNIIINSIELDNLIWRIYKSNKRKKSIVHHTNTIYY